MQIGNITISEEVFLLGTSITVALLVIYLVNKLLSLSTWATDLAFETGMIFILVWKASLLILSPQLVIRSPLSLLYFTGGYTGFIIAIFITIFYFHWKINKSEHPRNSLFLICFGLVSGFLIYELQLLISDTESIAVVSLLIIMLALLLVWKAHEWRFLDVMIWGSVLLIVTSQMEQSNLFGSISKQDWLYLTIATYTAVIQFTVLKRRKVS